MQRFDVYSKNGCGWCQKAKHFLESKSLTYTEYKIGVDAQKNDIEARISSLGLNVQVNTVPQIFSVDIDTGTSTYIGGFNELYRYLSGGAV